ncbi:MAG: hypothetical protein ACYC1U_06120 [Candidatus Aquicultorales bacterium]
MEILKGVVSAGLGGFTAGMIIFFGRIRGPLQKNPAARVVLAVAGGLGVMYAVDWAMGFLG